MGFLYTATVVSCRALVAFLRRSKTGFYYVRGLTRDPSSAAAQECSGRKGPMLHKPDEVNLPETLDGRSTSL